MHSRNRGTRQGIIFLHYHGGTNVGTFLGLESCNVTVSFHVLFAVFALPPFPPFNKSCCRPFRRVVPLGLPADLAMLVPKAGRETHQQGNSAY
jgi:hypothetical protein